MNHFGIKLVQIIDIVLHYRQYIQEIFCMIFGELVLKAILFLLCQHTTVNKKPFMMSLQGFCSSPSSTKSEQITS